MGRVNWVQMTVVGLVVLFVVFFAASLLAPWMGWSGGMMGGGGMMGPGMMGGWGVLGWLGMLVIPGILVALLVLGALWLARQVSPSGAGGGNGTTAKAVPCPHCGRFVQVGWRACPYCGNALAADGPPGDASP